ncbi:unnamed protein product [Boreogadus saida]
MSLKTCPRTESGSPMSLKTFSGHRVDPRYLPQDSEWIPDVPEDLPRAANGSQMSLKTCPRTSSGSQMSGVPEDLPQDSEWIPDVRCP